MTKPSRDANIGWLGFVLAALFIVLVTLFGAGNPSAAAAPWAQTRVGAFIPEAKVVLGTHDGIDVGQGVGNNPPTDDSALPNGFATPDPVAATPRPALEYGHDGAAPSYDASVRFVDAHTVVQVQTVGRHATAVSLRGQSGAASDGSVGVSGLVVAANTASKFGSLSHSSSGIASFSTQRALTAGKGGSIQAHHLVERRFARQIGGNTNSWPTVVVTRSEHQVFTNAWRGAITYGSGTRTASRAQIQGAARQIYADYPEILKALGLG